MGWEWSGSYTVGTGWVKWHQSHCGSSVTWIMSRSKFHSLLVRGSSSSCGGGAQQSSSHCTTPSFQRTPGMWVLCVNILVSGWEAQKTCPVTGGWTSLPEVKRSADRSAAWRDATANGVWQTRHFAEVYKGFYQLHPSHSVQDVPSSSSALSGLVLLLCFACG